MKSTTHRVHPSRLSCGQIKERGEGRYVSLSGTRRKKKNGAKKKRKKKKKRKNWRSGLWVEIGITNYHSERKFGERKIKFFTFFTFLGNPPLKSSNPKCSHYTHPPTMNITPLCSSHCTLHGGVGFIVIGLVDKND